MHGALVSSYGKRKVVLNAIKNGYMTLAFPVESKTSKTQNHYSSFAMFVYIYCITIMVTRLMQMTI